MNNNIKKIILSLAMVMSLVGMNAEARVARESFERHGKIIDILRRYERERRAGQRAEIEVRERDYISRRMTGMRVEMREFIDYVSKNWNAENMNSIKELFTLGSASNKNEVDRKAAEDIFGLVIKLDKSGSNMKISINEVAKAVTEWHQAEVVELRNVLKEAYERSQENGRSVLDNLKDLSIDAEIAKEIQKSCK